MGRVYFAEGLIRKTRRWNRHPSFIYLALPELLAGGGGGQKGAAGHGCRAQMQAKLAGFSSGDVSSPAQQYQTTRRHS